MFDYVYCDCCEVFMWEKEKAERWEQKEKQETENKEKQKRKGKEKEKRNVVKVKENK